MATQYMKDKPTSVDFAYVYAETEGGALVRVAKENVAGEGVTVDSGLSETSENPVQNKVVTEKLNELSEEKVGQKSQYFLMQAPNGTIYKVGITNSGTLTVVGESDEILEELLEGRLLVWNDEFDGDSVNSDNWMFRMDNETRTDSVVVSNSVMDMPCYYNEEDGVWHDYYIHSSGCEDVKFGRLEAKMKWDNGTMAAFWTVGQTSQKYNGVTEGIIWPRAGEIDIFESDGTNLYTTLHYGENEGAGIAHDSRRVFTISDLVTEKGIDPTEWHRYAVEWTDTEMIFYVDDAEYGRTDNNIMYEDGTRPFSMPHYLLISCYAKDTSNTSVVQHCYVDWVRYYAPIDIIQKIPIQSITLSESSISLNPNRVRELDLTISPDYVTDYTMRWYSTDRSVAKFNAGNRIEALAKGKVEISVVTKNGVTAKCDLVVSNDVVNNVSEIALDYGGTNTGYVGYTMTIVATVSPKWATYLECDWESSDVNIATVENGVVSFVGKGNVTITAKAKDTSGVSASVDLISKANITDNIDTDGCVVKFTKNGWNSETDPHGYVLGIWESDLKNVSSMNSGSSIYFRYSQGEGMYFTSVNSTGVENYTVANFDTSADFTICERVKIKSGKVLGSGLNILMLCDSELIAETTGTTVVVPNLVFSLFPTGNWTLRNQVDSGYVINQYNKTPVLYSVDENNAIVEDTVLNIVFTHASDGAWRLYNNGTLIAEGTDSITAETIENPILCVGSYPAKTRQNGEEVLYQGLLAYNKALSADEVTALNTALDEMYA